MSLTKEWNTVSLPVWGDVYPDMEDSSPFDEGYDITIRYVDDPDCSY